MPELSDREFDRASPILYFKVADLPATFGTLKARGVRFRNESHVIAEMPDHALWMAFF